MSDRDPGSPWLKANVIALALLVITIGGGIIGGTTMFNAVNARLDRFNAAIFGDPPSDAGLKSDLRDLKRQHGADMVDVDHRLNVITNRLDNADLVREAQNKWESTRRPMR